MNDENRKKFRSVLPHEPLPNEEYGYIHLQGGFEPKSKKSKDKNKKKSKEENEPSMTSPSTVQLPPSYWTVANLKDALSNALCTGYQSFEFPYQAKSIEILDPSPPYTKIRLTYDSPTKALETLMVWRSKKISPSVLFQNLKNNNDDKSGIGNSVNGDGPVQFSTGACQVTMITTLGLPAVAWTRSNPPKFRRLLHDNTDIEEQTQTRFVFVTGMLEKSYIQEDQQQQQQEQPNISSPGWKLHHILSAIRNYFNQYDSTNIGVEVFLSKKQQQSFPHACHIGMRTSKDAQKVVKELQGKVVTWQQEGDGKVSTEKEVHDDQTTLKSDALFLDYASVTQRSIAKLKANEQGEDTIRGEPSRPQCTSTTSSVIVPGLLVVENFVTETQEAVLMAVLTGPYAPWAPDQINKSQTGAVKRLVQHYGYVFDYKTADVLRDREKHEDGADCPPMPAVSEGKDQTTIEHDAEEGHGWDVLAGIIDKTRQAKFDVTVNDETNDAATTSTQTINRSYPNLNQLTVNHYKPGEGIGSHVDTPSAFDDGLISISLNSGIVMEFRNVKDPSVKKLVYLPQRSLVLMSGPARYEWEHMIVTRRTDTHNGVVIPRKLRLSLTIRTALSMEGNPLPLVESNVFPPTWGNPGNKQQEEQKGGALITPATERDHVHAVYDAIATQWHHTRGRRGVLWPGATQFLKRLPVGSVVADVGCGDGKYFPAVWEAGSYVIGTDISRPLLQTAFGGDDDNNSNNKNNRTNDDETNNVAATAAPIPESRRVAPHRKALSHRPAVAVADCMSVPLRTGSCDAAICIAVMHHLSTEERRIRCIEELVRIVKIGGTINIQAWAMEQEQNSRRRFASNDVFVPFNAQPKFLDKTTANNSQLSETDDVPKTRTGTTPTTTTKQVPVPANQAKSVAEMYSEAYSNADFDEKKGLVVFRRYCHLYKKGELEALVERVSGTVLIESGYESGNHFVILEVIK